MMALSLIQKTARCISSSTRCYSELTTSIPGLYIYRDFLRPVQGTDLQKNAINLHKEIVENSANALNHQCKTFLSQYHNLKSDEYYRLVEVDDSSGRKIEGQHFQKYGEDGHKLTYFVGNKNLPGFLMNGLLSRVLRIPEIMAIKQDKTLNWNFTFNTYAAANNGLSKLAGFDFHKDIESNGEVTMIYSIGAPTKFEIRHPNYIAESQTIPLLSNSLVVLSKQARWDYEHRVIPVTIEDSAPLIENEVESVRRISLVLGFARSGKAVKQDDDLHEKAMDLIWGDRKYQAFTAEEKQMVDQYQEKILEEGRIVLPNTALEQEQIELAQYIEERIMRTSDNSKTD